LNWNLQVLSCTTEIEELVASISREYIDLKVIELSISSVREKSFIEITRKSLFTI
jgi:hypothetical protein